jgi:hypothetical protein
MCGIFMNILLVLTLLYNQVSGDMLTFEDDDAKAPFA